jgi:hypothetical protein
VTDKVDLNTPPTKEEVDAWIAGLDDASKLQLRQLQLQNAAVNRKAEKAPDLGSMDDAQLRAYTKQFGF